MTGNTVAELAPDKRSFDWGTAKDGGTFAFPWPKAIAELALTQAGSGKPWVTVLSRAAVPLNAPLASGYRIARTVTPVAQKTAGGWTTGDIARVRLDLEAEQDMTWVVLSDPVPAGATHPRQRSRR